MRPDLQKRLAEIQQLELEEYISAFKSSSDRARYVIYINSIVSLLLLIATWNTLSWSWSRHRINLAEAPLRASYARQFELQHPRPQAVQTMPKRHIPPLTGRAWVKARDEYVRAKIRLDRATEYRNAALERVLFVPVPGLGMHVDVNDLGLLGGATLLILSLLLCLSMVRQHENLYLAFFKIRRLCESDRRGHHDGESMANFLYHALAMGQVLNYPPTLARWGYGPRNRLAGAARWAVLLMPALVQGLVFLTNVLTFEIAYDAWGRVSLFRMTLQFLLLAGISSLCILTGLYSRACNYRWRTAFELINPGLRFVEQRPWREWLRLPRAPHVDSHLTQLLTEVAYTVRPDDQPDTLAVSTATASLTLPGDGEPRISQTDLIVMAGSLYAEATRQLEKQTGAVIQHFEATRNVLDGRRWTVETKFSYRTGTPASRPTD